MEYDIDNVSITEIDPMESKVDAPTISEGHSHTENVSIKLYDYNNCYCFSVRSGEV